jgi:hypothetical protein
MRVHEIRCLWLVALADRPQPSSGLGQRIMHAHLAQFSVRGSFLQHVVADSQDGARHRNNGPCRLKLAPTSPTGLCELRERRKEMPS